MHPLSFLAAILFCSLVGAENYRFLRSEFKDNQDRELIACSTLTNYTQCQSVRSCIWIRGSCLGRTSWLGYAEIGQTHVTKAFGETRYAPKVIAEREAEFLFFPTQDVQPTVAPSAAPSQTINHVFGLEKIGDFNIDLPTATAVWPSGYPANSRLLLDDVEDGFYFPASVPDLNLNFDLQASRAVQGVYIKIWYYSRIDSIMIGLRPEDGASLSDPRTDYSVPDSKWTWINGGSHTSGLNKEITIPFDLTAARYVQIRIRGGWRGSSRTSDWGLRRLKISGSMDGSIVPGPNNEVNGPLDGVSYFPGESGDVLLEAYAASGSFLGKIKARPTSQQRGIMDQAEVVQRLTPYSGTREMWSSTLPWQWVKEGTELIISAKKPDGSFVAYSLKLYGIVPWSEHTLIRQKFVVFGNSSQFDALNTFTFEPSRLATGMFGIMPVASLIWVDATDLYWPYLVVATSKGARKVFNEAERRAVLLAAGDNPTGEPTWDVTKLMIAFRNSFANTGRGFTITALEASGEHGSPYSTQTSIAMGWAMVNNGTSCSFCEYKSLGYWDGWSAAASLGWCGMKTGDECGNTISHEIGHSMSLSHFTTGTAASWGISDQYPEDGTHLATHPWGYDTASRQFRTWYDPRDGTSKFDPMNGGGDSTIGSCYNHYTGYSGQVSQNWAIQSPQILSSDVSAVPSDGLYLYNAGTKSLVPASPETRFMAVVETGVPVVTFIGTLGSDNNTCQTYPPSRMSYGHTFQFPDPFGKTLASNFVGSAYAVEITFTDGSSQWGLIASPDLRGSNELRLYSFNVAISRKPTTVKLYRFNTDRYPNLSLGSAKTLLDTRFVNLPADPTANLPQATKTGRGWLGQSGDVQISRFCISDVDCSKKKAEVSWRGTEGSNLTFSASVPSSVHSTGSSLNIAATSKQTGTTYQITVRAARYVGESGWFPLLAAPPPGLNLTPDASHGVAFWLPYDANSNLPPGRYTALASVASGGIAGTPFVKLRIDLRLTMPLITDTVNLLAAPFTSKAFTTESSSIYFLAEDSTIGPTEGEWWGGSRATLTVPLVASNCKNVEVTASVKAQNKCGTSFFQMNAGRSRDGCPSGQSLYLALDDATANRWLSNTTYQGCRFETHSTAPVTINAFRWHEPNADKLLGSMTIKIVVDLPPPLVTIDTANLRPGPFVSRTFVNGTDTIYFLTNNSTIGPTAQVFSGGVSATLKVPLVSYKCGNARVTANIQAQNKCGSFLTQMNARKGVTNCGGNNLVLTLNNATTVNQWVTRAAYKGCLFETESPFAINVFRWLSTTSVGQQIASMKIAVAVDLAK